MSTWVERNRVHLENIRAYVGAFRGLRPPLFDGFAGGGMPRFPFEVGSDRGVALLLCFSALYQGIPATRLMGLLARLWETYGADFLRLNKLPFEELRARIDGHPGLDGWAIRKQAPGILRSACDFFYRHGSPIAWVRSIADGEECVRILCDEVFLMGKTSLFKSKPRYFLWLLTQIPDVGPEAFWGPRTLLPITPGHMRFLREFGPLQDRESVPWRGPEEKLAYVNRFFRLLASESPWTAYAPLDAYLKPAETGPSGQPGASSGTEARVPPRWQCRIALGGCLACPLAPLCPAREEP